MTIKRKGRVKTIKNLFSSIFGLPEHFLKLCIHFTCLWSHSNSKYGNIRLVTKQLTGGFHYQTVKLITIFYYFNTTIGITNCIVEYLMISSDHISLIIFLI